MGGSEERVGGPIQGDRSSNEQVRADWWRVWMEGLGGVINPPKGQDWNRLEQGAREENGKAPDLRGMTDS